MSERAGGLRATTGGRVACWVAVLLDVVATLALLVLPTGTTTQTGSDGTTTTTSLTLLQAQGPGSLLAPAVLTVLALLTAVLPWATARIVLAGVHAGVTVLALLTIGALFLPATVALLVGTVVVPRRTVTAPAAAPG